MLTVERPCDRVNRVNIVPSVINRLDPRSVCCIIPSMDTETLQISRSHMDSTHTGYSVRAKHSKTGDVIRESHATLKAAVSRGVELVQAGYSIEIWSPASLEEH